jgi:hypothetical protein
MSTTATTTTGPLAYAVWHREHRPRARWKRVAVVWDRMSALAVCTARGDWRLEPLTTPKQVAEASDQESPQGARQQANGTGDVVTGSATD